MAALKTCVLKKQHWVRERFYATCTVYFRMLIISITSTALNVSQSANVSDMVTIWLKTCDIKKKLPWIYFHLSKFTEVNSCFSITCFGVSVQYPISKRCNCFLGSSFLLNDKGHYQISEHCMHTESKELAIMEGNIDSPFCVLWNSLNIHSYNPESFKKIVFILN